MILAAGISDLSGETVTLILALILSFIGWLKNRYFDKHEEPDIYDEEEEKMREVVWRRQMGETTEESKRPWEEERKPAPTIRFNPPPVRVAVAPPPPPPPLPPPPLPTKLSQKQEELANAFERSTRRKTSAKSGRRTSHRKQVDRLLRSPSAAKDAILLMEILGPPIGMKPEHQPEG